jgi:hypothetical protein
MMRMTPGIAVKAGLVLSHSIGIAMRQSGRGRDSHCCRSMAVRRVARCMSAPARSSEL